MPMSDPSAPASSSFRSQPPKRGSEARRSSPLTAQQLAPWAASLMLHIGLVAIGFAITWTVMNVMPEREPALIVAQFDALEYRPVPALETVALPDAQVATEPSRMEAPSQTTLTSPSSPSLDALTAPSAIDLLPGASQVMPPSEGGAVAFAGVAATNARKIVYVVDASGSMVRAMSIILDELRRSLQQLGPRQEFGVVFFQRRQALVVPPSGRMVPGTTRERDRVMQWIESNVLPEGRSNPLAAIEYALTLKPDVIFLLSENITGSGEFEIDQALLLERLDALNPLDPRSGRRPVRINCIQFLDPDPIDTLRRIAEQHGDERGFRFLSRAELGLRSQ